MREFEGRDHLWRFLPGDEWKKLPDCFKAPNRGLRVVPRRKCLCDLPAMW